MKRPAAGIVAILIATLPISMASFSLKSKYKIGGAQLSANAAVGTLLMLHPVIIWSLVVCNQYCRPLKIRKGLA